MTCVHGDIIEHSRDTNISAPSFPSNDRVVHVISDVAFKSLHKFESKPVCVCLCKDESTLYILLHSGQIVKQDDLVVVGFVQGMTCDVLFTSTLMFD